MRRLILCSAIVFAAASARGTVVWDESVNGSLSSSGSSPTAFTLAPGVSSVIGTVGGSASQDWINITVPAGDELSELVLGSYQSTDAQGFFGVQAGSAFVGSTTNPASYLGYTHFGTGAQNGALPPTNLVTHDLLPLMGNTSLAAGSAGFTPPLASGSYTFLIQQLGSSTNYDFDFQVTAVPEPGMMGAVAIVAMMAAGARRRRA
jgi:hypothetical protein